MLIFDPSMSTSQIQAQVDAIANQQFDQFRSQRSRPLLSPAPAALMPLKHGRGYHRP